MKQVTYDETVVPNEIQNSICYRLDKVPCTNGCPFHEHMPSSPLGDIVVITCNTYQTILQVTGYTV